jgi:hypothetical protein
MPASLPNSLQLSPDGWVPWFEVDAEGFVQAAGIDTADRKANIGVTTCDNLEADDIATANACIIGDTLLLAKARDLWVALQDTLTIAIEYASDDPHSVAFKRLEQYREMLTRMWDLPPDVMSAVLPLGTPNPPPPRTSR